MLRGGWGVRHIADGVFSQFSRNRHGTPSNTGSCLPTSQSPNPICAHKAAGAQPGSPGTNSAEAGLRRRRRAASGLPPSALGPADLPSPPAEARPRSQLHAPTPPPALPPLALSSPVGPSP